MVTSGNFYAVVACKRGSNLDILSALCNCLNDFTSGYKDYGKCLVSLSLFISKPSDKRTASGATPNNLFLGIYLFIWTRDFLFGICF